LFPRSADDAEIAEGEVGVGIDPRTAVNCRPIRVTPDIRQEKFMLDLLAQVVDKAPFATGAGLAGMGAGIGMGLTVVGGGVGIGRLAGSALEGMARQPEIVNKLLTNMLLAAALIEGFTFLALVFCFLLIGKVMPG
jgi:F-type H+-transporting ATPase subunit c